MAESGMQIDWSNKTTASVVLAARQKLAASKAADVPANGGATAGGRLKAAGRAASIPGLYALAVLVLVVAGMAGVWKLNVLFAPEMYDERGMTPAAKAHAEGRNYAVFDLNLNIRKWREEHVARFKTTPDVVVLGASHWQEAHAGLVRSERMYNGHIHRDYWEDLLGVVEVYVRNKQMPKRMIIAVRDNQFKPVDDRTDFLWEPGIPNYRRMAERLGLPVQPAWKTYPWQRMKERLSLTMLFTNVTRWFNAAERPHATDAQHYEQLDLLLPDGSILWSGEHHRFFTQERARAESLSFAESKRHAPPKVDPLGLRSFDALLAFIKAQGTQVVLVHPPFNPIYYDALKGSPYMKGLDRVRQITRDLAAKHGLPVIGEFDPAKVGCTADQYIDAEHANPACLQNIFNEYEAILPALRAAEAKAKS